MGALRTFRLNPRCFREPQTALLQSKLDHVDPNRNSGIHGYRYCQRFDYVLELLFTSQVHIEPYGRRRSHVVSRDEGSRYFQEP